MSVLTEKIISTSAVLAALGVIVTTIIACYKFLRKWEKWKEEKDKHDREQYIDILRIKIMMPEMPLSERIAAGDKYVNEFHQNGCVKQKYLELLQIYSNEHKE